MRRWWIFVWLLAASAAPVGTRDAGAQPGEFVPSERIRADAAVSFPVDI